VSVVITSYQKKLPCMPGSLFRAIQRERGGAVKTDFLELRRQADLKLISCIVWSARRRGWPIRGAAGRG
jgi:hypothetical protein